MPNLTFSDKLVLLQYTIVKYDSETLLKEKIKEVLSVKDVERGIDTLIGTQKVRRIGQDVLQNNTSHTGDLPELPNHVREIVERI